MSQLQLYKGLKSEYSGKKDKIADGGLVITKKENNSSVGNLYINDGGTHVQLSSDEAVTNVTMSENNELIVSKINGSSNTILIVDETLKSDSNNPVENKAIYTKFESQNTDIENNIKTPLNTLIGNDNGKSVRDISIDVLTEQLVPETAQESLDTLKEIADWIQKHPQDAAAMNTAIQNNADEIDDIQLDIMRLDVQSDWELNNNQSHAYILNKPAIKSGSRSGSVMIGNNYADDGTNLLAIGAGASAAANIATIDTSGNAWFKGNAYVLGNSKTDAQQLITAASVASQYIAKTGAEDISGDLAPISNNTYSLGTTDKLWAKVYAAQVQADHGGFNTVQAINYINSPTIKSNEIILKEAATITYDDTNERIVFSFN